MISGGKLLLLVRVEGTLVDVAKPVSVDKWPAEQRQQLQLSVKTQHPNDTSLLQLPGSLLWVKLRPGIRTCLRQLSACFSMRLVCSLGALWGVANYSALDIGSTLHLYAPFLSCILQLQPNLHSATAAVKLRCNMARSHMGR